MLAKTREALRNEGLSQLIMIKNEENKVLEKTNSKIIITMCLNKKKLDGFVYVAGRSKSIQNQEKKHTD